MKYYIRAMLLTSRGNYWNVPSLSLCTDRSIADRYGYFALREEWLVELQERIVLIDMNPAALGKPKEKQDLRFHMAVGWRTTNTYKVIANTRRLRAMYRLYNWKYVKWDAGL